MPILRWEQADLLRSINSVQSILNLIIHLVKTIIKVCLTLDVVFIIGVKGVYFLNQSGLDGITLAKLFFAVGDLLLDSGGIHLHADFLLHQGGKLQIAD